MLLTIHLLRCEQSAGNPSLSLPFIVMTTERRPEADDLTELLGGHTMAELQAAFDNLDQQTRDKISRRLRETDQTMNRLT